MERFFELANDASTARWSFLAEFWWVFAIPLVAIVAVALPFAIRDFRRDRQRPRR